MHTARPVVCVDVGWEDPPSTGHREDSRAVCVPKGVPSGGAWQEAYSPPRAQPGRAVTIRGSFDSSAALLRPSSLFSGPQGKDPTSGPGRAGKGLAVPAEAAAARRGRGGAAPPPLSPNRVTGGAARVSLCAEKCGPNSQDRSRPPLTRLPLTRGIEAQALPPGGAPPRRVPTAQAPGPALTTRPGPAGRARRGGRRPLPAWALRAATSLHTPQPPGGGSGGAAAVTRRPRGGKLRSLPAPPAAALPPPGTKETKPRRPGPLRSFPPAPAGPPSPRPPPRPGRKQPRESGARPEPPRTPHSSPPQAPHLQRLGNSTPLLCGAGTPAVAMATRITAEGG